MLDTVYPKISGMTRISCCKDCAQQPAGGLLGSMSNYPLHLGGAEKLLITQRVQTSGFVAQQ